MRCSTAAISVSTSGIACGSARHREQFGNGDWFTSAGTTIDIARKRADRPAKEFLEWHNDEVFLSA